MPGYPQIDTLVAALAITDATAHNPSTDAAIDWAEVSVFESFTILVVSTLDQPLTVRLFGNYRENNADPAQAFLATIAVPAAGSNSRTYAREMDGWLPYVYPQIQAAGIPTTGTVTIRIIKSKRMESWE